MSNQTSEGKRRIAASLIFVGLTLVVYLLWPYTQSEDEPARVPADSTASQATLPAEPEPHPTAALYGITLPNALVMESQVRSGETLGKILAPYRVPYLTIDKLARASKQVFDVRRLAANKKYSLICSPDTTALALIYEPNAMEYVVFRWDADSVDIRMNQRKIDTVERTLQGVIHSSLYNTLLEGGASPALVGSLEDVYAWQIDFFHLQKGDRIKLIYEELQVEGKAVGIGRIHGACFTHGNSPYYAVYYDQGKGSDYFDEQGNSMRKAFLRAPLKYSRISSRYSRRRFHPVQKRWKAHLGTDYAAPIGTPIYAVGDGVVLEARYSRYNGNYVKIRHNSVYTTQYLHMNRIAKGLRVGQRVRQGQVIGEVGRTGLATGPHLCYRFWKNGVQVDALKVEIPPSEPIDSAHRTRYMQTMRHMVNRLEFEVPFADLDPVSRPVL